MLFTLPAAFIREHHEDSTTWEKVKLRGLEAEIEKYKGEAGFEQIAKALGVPRPTRTAGQRD